MRDYFFRTECLIEFLIVYPLALLKSGIPDGTDIPSQVKNTIFLDLFIAYFNFIISVINLSSMNIILYNHSVIKVSKPKTT